MEYRTPKTLERKPVIFGYPVLTAMIVIVCLMMFLFIVFNSMAFGQIKQSVTGLVTDAITKPLAGANIKLEKQDSSVLLCQTKPEGFLFQLSPADILLK